MYKYPYGDSQQLNLDWILAKLKELEASGASGGADLEEVSNALISLTYNTSTAYRRYDYAFLNGKLYRCLSDTSGVFNPTAWQEALIGDDLAVLTRWINAIDAAAVVDVKFDTTGTNGKIQQKYHDQYHDVVEVDYTPVQNSKRPLSSNAGYELKGAINALAGKTITYERKDLATSDISTPVNQGVYVWYITTNTPDNFGTGGVILVIAFASWLIAQLGYGNNGKMYFRQYNTGAWSAWQIINTDTAPIIPPPDFYNSVKKATPLLDGTITSYSVTDSGWYQARAINRAVSGECLINICNADGSTVYDSNYYPGGTYVRAPSNWTYYKAGQTIYYRIWATDTDNSGLFYAAPIT